MLPDIAKWNAAVKQLTASNLGSSVNAQLQGLSGEVQKYVGVYDEFMEGIQALTDLRQQSQDLQGTGANPGKVAALNVQLADQSAKMNQQNTELKQDQPKIANVLRKFADFIDGIAPKEGRKPLTPEQQAALNDCTAFLKDFASQLKVSSELAQPGSVYGKSNKPGEATLKIKSPPTGEPSTGGDE